MSKVLVFCIDALCASDVDYMKEMPNFGAFLRNAAVVEKIEPVWPALTYCCHTSIITGCYVNRHGIVHNEILKRGGYMNQPWYNQKSDVKVPTLLDAAMAQGKTACSISWPVSGGANYTLNMPMIVPYSYTGYEPEKYLVGNCTQELLDKYFHKHGRYIKGSDRSLDLFTMAMALDVLEDYDQPDIMLVKMCDLDGARHTYGVHHDKVKEQLRKHDEEFGSIIEVLRRKGTLEETNVVILGDHGQTNVTDALHMNVLFKQHGLIRLNEDGSLKDFDALLHSTGLCAYIELGDPNDMALKAKVGALLESLKDDPRFQLAYVLDKAEAIKKYNVDGPFDFIVESRLPITFGERFDLDDVYGTRFPGDHKIGAATHGGSPEREELTTFMAAGPDIKKGVVIKRRSMVDEAPTMAKMLGIELPDTDGKIIEGILN